MTVLNLSLSGATLLSCDVAVVLGLLRRAAWFAAAFLILAGCADQRIRSESDRLMHDSRYEQAYELLEDGLKQYPDSMLLRSGSLQARNAALNRLLDDAASARAEGALDEAEALLQRAQRFDTSGRRVSSLLAELAIERKQRGALVEAEGLASKKKVDDALRVLAEGLKDNPRQPELLALQRRLQAEQRRAQVKAVQLGLSETRPISLDFRDANLRTVLDVVTRNSGVNFVLDKDIKADVRVTVYLRSARVEDAIDLIVSTHQLAKKVIDSQTLLIYPNTPEKQREYQEQVVRVFYLANAEAKGAAAFLKSMLRSKDSFVDERSNMLALRDTPEMIEMAERLISLYDTADAEVVLELEVLEIRTNRLLELGVQFPDSLSLTPLAPSSGSGGSGGSGLTVSNLNRLGWDRVGVGVSGLLVNLKRQVGDVNTLANPRIRVRSKDKAKVLIGDKVPVVSATTGQTGFVSDSVSYLDVGLKLDVEPTVYSDDDVAIKIGLEVSSIAQQVTTKSGTLAYQIGTRSASTVLRLRDGETQLLAGLISRDERSSANRIPGLGDLPLAGRLFGSQRDEAVRTELVLAITPRVVRNMRRPEVSESELWVGTDASPRIRGVGGLVAKREMSETSSVANPASPANAVVGGSASPAVDAPPAQPKPAVKLRLQGPSQTRTGEVVSVALEVDTNAPIRGMPLQFKYSQSQLELLDVDEGDYFKSDGMATGFTKSVDASSGVVKVGVLRNQAKGATGRGAVVRLKFKALRPGAAEVSLMSADPISLGSPLPPVPLPPLFRVQVQ